MANLTVRLYRALKSDGWRQRTVKNKELPNLKDLPDGEGKFYPSYQQDGRRKMQPVDRLADAACVSPQGIRVGSKGTQG